MKCTTATTVLFATTALADFQIYFGYTASWVEPSQPSLGELLMFNREPDCEAAANGVVAVSQNYDNDASSGGYASDFTGDTTENYRIDRLEIYDGEDSPVTNMALGHITLRPQEGTGEPRVFDIGTVDLDGNAGPVVGTCVEDKGDDYTCAAGAGAVSAQRAFLCTAAGLTSVMCNGGEC